jgi:hypothetical protein
MTLLGKILVFVNLLLSFLMLSWAVGLYTNRVDWTATKAKGDKPDGVLLARQERIKTANASLLVAGDRWRSALRGIPDSPVAATRDGLFGVEKRIADDRKWYADQLAEGKQGPGGQAGKQQINWIKFGPDGLAVSPTSLNRPALEPAIRRKSDKPDETGRPLYCYQYYVADLARITQAIDAQQVAYQDAVKQAADLTQLAIGPKGLRQRIADEQVKNSRVKEEMRDVLGRETNAIVETEILASRQGQLEKRVEELQKTQGEKKSE